MVVLQRLDSERLRTPSYIGSTRSLHIITAGHTAERLLQNTTQQPDDFELRRKFDGYLIQFAKVTQSFVHDTIVLQIFKNLLMIQV